MDNKSNRPRKLPHQFCEKIKRIRSLAGGQGPPVSAHRAAIRDLLDEIEGDAQTRHDYVHGAVIAHYIDQGTITATLAAASVFWTVG